MSNIGKMITKSVSRLFRLTGGEQRLAPYFWTEGSVGSYSYGGYSLLEFIENGYMNPYVFQCIDKIADVSSQLPFSVIDEKTGKVPVGKNADELLKLIERPNDRQTCDDFYYEVVTSLLATGNCFIRAIKPVGFSRFAELTVMLPQFTAIETVDGTLWGKPKLYRYNGVMAEIPASEVLHIKFPNLTDRTNWGLSPLQAGQFAYEASNNIFEASASLHKNRGISGILSNADSNMPMMPKEQAALQEEWQNRTAGAHRFGKVYVTNAAMKYLPMGMTSVEMQSLEGGIDKLRTICSLFGLDSSLFNDPANKTYNNRADAEKSMYTSVVIPLLDKINRNISRFLASNFQIDNALIVADYSQVAILRENEAAKSAKVLAEVAAGVITAEEGRAILYPNLAAKAKNTGI